MSFGDRVQSTSPTPDLAGWATLLGVVAVVGVLACLAVAGMHLGLARGASERRDTLRLLTRQLPPTLLWVVGLAMTLFAVMALLGPLAGGLVGVLVIVPATVVLMIRQVERQVDREYPPPPPPENT